VVALERSVGFICHNCPWIEVLGVHISAVDFVRVPCNGLMPVANAVSGSARHFSLLKRIIIGMGKLPFETVELTMLPMAEREEEFNDWMIMLLARIQVTVEGTDVFRKRTISGVGYRR
jgi:hypothetical protein